MIVKKKKSFFSLTLLIDLTDRYAKKKKARTWNNIKLEKAEKMEDNKKKQGQEQKTVKMVDINPC